MTSSLSAYCILAVTILAICGVDGLVCKVCSGGTGTTGNTCTLGSSTCTATSGWCYNTSGAGVYMQNCYALNSTVVNGTVVANTAGCTTILGLKTCLCNSKDQCNSFSPSIGPSTFMVMLGLASMFVAYYKS